MFAPPCCVNFTITITIWKKTKPKTLITLYLLTFSPCICCFSLGDLSASDTSLVDLVERVRGPLPPELMPLPSSGRESPLEWTHLVDVANTFDSERNTHYGIKPLHAKASTQQNDFNPSVILLTSPWLCIHFNVFILLICTVLAFL